MECCPDFRKVCTVAASCEGRCFEAFERGRECDCDADCERYGKCCPDYAKHCKEAHTEKPTPETPPDNKAKRSSTDEEELPEEAVEDPEIQVTTPAPTTEPAETTLGATESPTTKEDSPTTPNVEDKTPEATEEPATEAEPPTPDTAEDVTLDATEEPLTEENPTDLPPTQDPTPDSTEAQATEAEPPSTPTPEETTPEEETTPDVPTTKADSPTTPKPEETTPDEPTIMADSPTTPQPDETTPEETTTPQPNEAVTPTEKETTIDTEQAGPAVDKESPGATCVIVEMTTAGKKDVTTIKEMDTIPEKEMEDITEKAPGIAKEEVTTVTKETTTRDKKDTIEEMYLVSNGTSKPTIHFQEVTEAREEPHTTEPETLPVKEEPEINKPLIQVGDLPMFPGETQESKNDEKDLCSGKPADGMVALPNGTLAVFRGHYYWLLNGRTPPTTNPRRISDGWGIPSPIDSGPLYWRFTNGVMDQGYPKPLATGFAGLSGRIVATLPVARYNNRPESVYFIKRDGNMQQYVYRQEPAKKCQRRARVTIRYPAFVPRVVIRRRFQRAVRMPTVIRTVRINAQPSGILRKEIQMTSYWRGLPKVIHSTLSVPNQNKPDGYDYYAFSYNRYYSLDIGKRIARPVTALTGKTVSKDWYNCPSK
ncbi:hypothetical protein Nmel_011084 [Mimus melanotis]